METAWERTAEAHLTSHWDSDKLPALVDDVARNSSISKPPPACRPRPTGKDFLKRKCPFWLKRKGAASSPRGPVVPKSRLCMEASHESPIQAVRKTAVQDAVLGLDSDEESEKGKMEASLLRKLLCLKATSPRLKKPARGLGVSPLDRASVRCGPAAVLGRTPDPQGESPLRWKPRAETQRPAEATSIAEAEAVVRLGGSWMTKPWRTFRAMIASRTKKRPVLPEDERGHGTPGKGDLCLSTETEAAPTTGANEASGEPSSNITAEEEKETPSAFPSKVENTHRAHGGHKTARHGLESHQKVGGEDFSGTLVELDAEKTSSLLSLENSHRKLDPVLKNMVEQGFCQTQVCDLPEVGAEAAEVEEQGPEQGDYGPWADVSPEEEQDLADLAENPGGQGMLMGMRDLGWLNSELLGSPVIRKWETERHVTTGSYPEIREMKEENAVMMDTSRGNEHTGDVTLGLATGVTNTGSYFFPPPASESNRSQVETLGSCDTSEAYTLAGAPFPSGGFERGIQENRLSQPTSKPSQAAAVDEVRERSWQQRSPAGKLPLSTEETLDAAGPEEERDKRLIYRAAVEIVGAAIDVATEQLAKRENQAQAGSEMSRSVP